MRRACLRSCLIAVLAVAGLGGCTGTPRPGACAPCAAVPAAPPAAPPNAVQAEMRELERVLGVVVHAVGVADLTPIPPAIEQLHAAKERTSAAVGDGSYLPPAGRDQLALFTALDEAFHAELAGLYRAAAGGDVPATAAALGRVVAGCPGCHLVFRP